MNTQRELDIAQVEAKLKVEKLFEEWRKSYLGRRAEVQDADVTGYGGAESEDREAADAEIGGEVDYSEAGNPDTGSY